MTDAGRMTGAVTFLFSDIEGSTRLELELGTERYATLRERHRALLRAAFAMNGGEEQSTEGDSFFVVFPTARNALAAALDAQRSLAAEAWPSGAEVRVRMGIHSGEATRVGGDLVGYDINRAARIAGAAHGGQVLVSEAARSLAGVNLGEGVELRDLGPHRLKDLRAPERLAQLIAPGLTDTFPPLRALDARPNNLPTQLTPFVGRERELDEARTLLATTRLLTLTGPGGTGKTRLSLQLAAAVADEFPDGVWFVRLEPVREVALVVPTIARTIGLADNASRSALDVLTLEVADRRVLFVLDNFEQVIDAAVVVTDLLERCPHLAIVVTSRAPLRVTGEQEYPVPGLPAPPDTARLSEVERLNLPPELRPPDAETAGRFESVRLFATRAAAVRPGWSLTDENAPTVASICARLHGMPLAIELAAARVKLLTVDQILTRLEDQLALLAHGSRDVTERQQTLRGAIAWSYDLLDEDGRRLLQHLAVFVGGWELEAAEAVCGGSTGSTGGLDVFDGLVALADQSLVRRVGEDDAAPRFAMLDTIRAFAWEMLAASGALPAARARHAAVFRDLAERAAPHLSGADQRVWLDRLERDHDNIRAALDWALDCPDPELGARLGFAMWRFWQQRGYLNEARDRLTALEAIAGDLQPVLRARLAEACGGVAYWQANHEEAARWYDEALRIWREIDDSAEIANALYNRAYAFLVRVMRGERADGTEEDARRMLEEALARYRQLGDRRGEANILWATGTYHYFITDPAEARPWYDGALELHRAVGQRTMEAWSLHMLALTLIRTNDVEEARSTARRALELFHAAGDVAGITLVLDDLSIVAIVEGNRERAGRLWGAARHLQATTGADIATSVESAFEAQALRTPRRELTAEELGRYGPEGAALRLDEVVAYALEAPAGDAGAAAQASGGSASAPAAAEESSALP